MLVELPRWNLSCVHAQTPLSVARLLMAASLDIRDSFDDLKGPELVMGLHEEHPDDLVLQVGPSALDGRDRSAHAAVCNRIRFKAAPRQP